MYQKKTLYYYNEIIKGPGKWHFLAMYIAWPNVEEVAQTNKQSKKDSELIKKLVLEHTGDLPCYVFTIEKRDITTGLRSLHSSTTMVLSTTSSMTSLLLLMPYLLIRKLLVIQPMLISKGKFVRHKRKLLRHRNNILLNS